MNSMGLAHTLLAPRISALVALAGCACVLPGAWGGAAVPPGKPHEVCPEREESLDGTVRRLASNAAWRLDPAGLTPHKLMSGAARGERGGWGALAPGISTENLETMRKMVPNMCRLGGGLTFPIQADQCAPIAADGTRAGTLDEVERFFFRFVGGTGRLPHGGGEWGRGTVSGTGWQGHRPDGGLGYEAVIRCGPVRIYRRGLGG